MDTVAEVELARLQRQHRIMEGDRAAYIEEMTVKLAKQRRVIESLRKEHETLLAQHRAASRSKNGRKEKKIEKLMKEHESYCEKLAEEKANLKETEHQIRKIERQVLQLRPKQITDRQCEIRVKSGKKTVEMLENTLDNAIRRFCVTLSENGTLRREIDHLVKERELFNAVYEKKLGGLEEGKRRMSELVERATSTFDQREDFCNKLAALEERNRGDVVQHGREMRELQRRLECDAYLRDFLGVKGQKRVMRDLEIKEKMKREREREKAEREMRTLEETLAKIVELTGEENVDRLAAGYRKQEEENFALFNYVNELTAEIEEITNRILLLKESVGKCSVTSRNSRQSDFNSRGAKETKRNKIATAKENFGISGRGTEKCDRRSRSRTRQPQNERERFKNAFTRHNRSFFVVGLRQSPGFRAARKGRRNNKPQRFRLSRFD